MIKFDVNSKRKYGTITYNIRIKLNYSYSLNGGLGKLLS